MSAFKIEYVVKDVGWATVTFVHGDWRSSTPVSYLTDPLDSLAWGTLALFDDHIHQNLDKIVFDAEGGGLRLRVDVDHGSTREDKMLNLRFEDLAPDLPHPPSELPHSFSIAVREFASAVLTMLEAVYEEHGIVGYNARWLSGDFPVAAMVRIRHELRLAPIQRRLW